MSDRSDLALRHLAQVVESSDDAIVSKDLDGTIISWNRAAERMFGYTAAEAIGRSIRMIIPADRQAEEDTVLATIRAGGAVSALRDDPPAQGRQPAADLADRVADPRRGGHRRRRLEDRPRHHPAASRRPSPIERLAAVVASSDDAIVSKDLDGIITSWNPAAERMFGYTRSRGDRPVDPDAHPGRAAERRRRRPGPICAPATASITTRPCGSARTAARISISLTVSPIRDDAGAVVGASKIARDITEQVRLRRRRARARRDHPEARPRSAPRSPRRSTATPSCSRSPTPRPSSRTAAFGAFFYNVVDAESGDAYMLYTLSGAPKEAFAQFPHPRATAIFAPTFHGEGPVRLDDVTQDPRFGQNPPFHGMPPGHLPVRSYLAVPVNGVRGGRARRAVLRASRAGVVHRAARAARRRHRRLGVGRARERAAVRRGAGRQPDEGRVPGRPLARAAHAAQRHRRLRAAAARRHAGRREGRRAASRRSSATPTG